VGPPDQGRRRAKYRCRSAHATDKFQQAKGGTSSFLFSVNVQSGEARAKSILPRKRSPTHNMNLSWVSVVIFSAKLKGREVTGRGRKVMVISDIPHSAWAVFSSNASLLAAYFSEGGDGGI